MFPYENTRKYSKNDIEVIYDISCKMNYVMHNGKRLYFPARFDKSIKNYYNALRKEQDAQSPHRYEVDGFIVREGDIIADVGAAEGNWALDNIEKAGRVYLFETDGFWVEALSKTFEPWKEKVTIVNKFVSNKNTKNETTLDEYFKDKRLDFIKADIEGAEISLLLGAKNVLADNSNLKLLICTYHRQDDGKRIKEILESSGYYTEYSQKYMLYINDPELEEPYIRRGLIRARNM